MEPDQFQKAWQSQTAQAEVRFDSDLMLKEIVRNQATLQGTIKGRDFVEIGVSLMMIPIWFFLGQVVPVPWTWYLGIPGMVWVASFLLVHRTLHDRKATQPADTLLQTVQTSLAEVNDQIWLLKNVVWWYLMPFYIPLTIFFVHVAWQFGAATGDKLEAIGFGGFLVLLVTGIYYFIYRLNQKAVDKELVPRREELLAVLASLDGQIETDDQNPSISGASAKDKYSQQGRDPGQTQLRLTRHKIVRLALTFVLLALVTTVASLLADQIGRSMRDHFPKLSPFRAIRWKVDLPEVKVEQEWYELLAIDDLTTKEMLDFSRQTYGDDWRKRFEEDLVELLIKMGHDPGTSVKLDLQQLDSGQDFSHRRRSNDLRKSSGGLRV